MPPTAVATPPTVTQDGGSGVGSVATDGGGGATADDGGGCGTAYPQKVKEAGVLPTGSTPKARIVLIITAGALVIAALVGSLLGRCCARPPRAESSAGDSGGGTEFLES